MRSSFFINRNVWFSGVIILLLGALMGLLLVHSGIGAGAIQPDEASAPARGYRVQIHRGPCETLDPEETLALTGAVLLGGTNEAGWAFASETVVEMPVGSLLDEPYGIAVVAENGESVAGIPLACGEINGQVTNGKLVHGLISNTTGDLAGVVVLTDQGGRQTVVELYMILASDGATIGPGGPDGEADEPQDAADDNDDNGDGLDSDDDGV